MGNSTLSLGGGDARRISEVITQSGHSFVAGDVVRADDVTPAEYILAQADSSANAEAVGIIETVAGDSFELVYQGRIDLSGASWTDLPFAATSEVWFLSPTIAGELTRTPPNTAGTVIKAMLVVTDDTVGAEVGVLTGYIGVQIGSESTVNINDIQPVGTILAWAAPSAAVVPSGWQLCNGDSLVRVDFPELFSVINVDYGLGDDDPNTFNVPDLRGRVGVGLDGVTAGVLTGNNNAGDSGGEEDHILTVAELPDHQIVLGVNFVTFTGGVNRALVPLGFGGGGDIAQGFTPLPPPSPQGPGPPVGPPGNDAVPTTGLPHNTMQPFLVINYLIRVTAQSSIALLDHDLSQHSDVGDVSNPNDCDFLKFQNGQWEAAPGGTPAGTAVFSFRNQIINGRFDVWQRGVGTFDAVAIPSGGRYTADRWVFGGGDGGGVRTSAIDQGLFTLGQTDVPGSPRQFMEYQNSVVGGDSNENSVLIQRIEDVRTFNGETVTVSFWAKSDVAPAAPNNDKITVHFRQFFGGGGGSAANIIAGQEITLTTTWTYYTLTFALPNIGGKTLGSVGDDSLRLRFVTQAGVNAAIALNLPGPVDFVKVLHLANVQVEEGDTATAFEIQELTTELSLCQRYYQKAASQPVFTSGGVAGNIGAAVPGPAGGITGVISFPVIMRTTPSVVIVNLVAGAGGQAVAARDNGITVFKAGIVEHVWSWTADAEL